MPSLAHQFIADNIIRKMNIDGYSEIAYDGKKEFEELRLQIPPKIIRHRPDILSADVHGMLAIGEAKTANDFTDHTFEQIADFHSTGCKVYIGIPESAQLKLSETLHLLGIDVDELIIVVIPDRLLPHD